MPPGVILNSAGVFSGTPSQSGTFGPYVFKVTDSSNNQVSSPSMSIMIAASELAITTTTLPDGTVNTQYSASLAATGGASPYTWAITSGGALPTGLTVSSGGVISGTPTTTGTFGPYVFTATDSKGATANSTPLSLTINGPAAEVCPAQGNEAALTSANPYAFLLKGTDSKGGALYIAGSFTPNGAGGITNAVADYNGLTGGPQALQVNLAASSYSLNGSAAGCLYLAFSGTTSGTVAVPVANVQFSFFLGGLKTGVYNTGRIIEADYTKTKTSASGFMHVQTPAAFAMSALQANYAFGVDGWTSTAPAVVRTAMAGTFTNSSGTLSAGYSDVNTAGTASGEITGGYGNLNTTIDPNSGRGTGSYFLTTPSGPLTYDFVFYILNGSDLILLSTDLVQQNVATPLLAGRALASSAANSVPALNGYYLLASQGLQTLGINIGNIAEIGTVNATSAGAIPLATIYSNFAGTYASNQYTNASYTLEAASGRAATAGLASDSPVIYLTNGTADDGIVGFLVGTDLQASSGVMVSQTTTAPAYGVGNVMGNYAASSEEDADGKNGAFLGQFNFSGTGTYSLVSATTGTYTGVPASGSIQVNADGSGNLNGGNFPLVTNGTALYMIPNSGDPLLLVLTQ
jgi:hypothetical protein